MIRDDMNFKPYPSTGEQDGWQCKIETSKGVISVRYGGRSLMAYDNSPYEVWYPDQDAPTGYQTADMIFDYIKDNMKNKFVTLD